MVKCRGLLIGPIVWDELGCFVADIVVLQVSKWYGVLISKVLSFGHLVSLLFGFQIDLHSLSMSYKFEKLRELVSAQFFKGLRMLSPVLGWEISVQVVSMPGRGVQFAIAELPLLELMDCGMTVCDSDEPTSEVDETAFIATFSVPLVCLKFPGKMFSRARARERLQHPHDPVDWESFTMEEPLNLMVVVAVAVVVVVERNEEEEVLLLVRDDDLDGGGSSGSSGEE
ncbi:hypothetical protein LguiB_032692 [Lonicera macranthoides]